MTIERARTQTIAKPWGVLDLRPWNKTVNDGNAIGEIWYDRPGTPDSNPALLLKLLFTNQPLSIQVHPDDAHARSMGLRNGKTEVWYVLSARADAKVALGLSDSLTKPQLRHAIQDGTIADLVAWRGVTAGDVIFVPAGTIHAIGAGLVIAEIQQRSDTTFRLFDHGRQRDLHVDQAIAVADRGPAEAQARPRPLGDGRTLLSTNPYFSLEGLELTPGAAWQLDAERETWLLVLSGDARAGSCGVTMGDAIFAQSQSVSVRAGPKGMSALLAYVQPSSIAAFPCVATTQKPVAGTSKRATAFPDATSTSARPAKG